MSYGDAKDADMLANARLAAQRTADENEPTADENNEDGDDTSASQ
jgi:hypothetical protein